MDGLFSAHVLWFLAGVILLLAELATPGFVLLFFALGAFVAALAAYALAIGTGGQIAVFLIASIAGLALLRRMFLRVFRGRTRAAAAGDEQDSGAGRTAVVTRAIAPGRPGEIKFRGSFWRAHSRTAAPAGGSVIIVGPAEDDPGAYLVRPADENTVETGATNKA